MIHGRWRFLKLFDCIFKHLHEIAQNSVRGFRFSLLNLRSSDFVETKRYLSCTVKMFTTQVFDICQSLKQIKFEFSTRILSTVILAKTITVTSV